MHRLNAPALVDPGEGWSHDWRTGGPIPLAQLRAQGGPIKLAGDTRYPAQPSMEANVGARASATRQKFRLPPGSPNAGARGTVDDAADQGPRPTRLTAATRNQ